MIKVNNKAMYPIAMYNNSIGLTMSIIINSIRDIICSVFIGLRRGKLSYPVKLLRLKGGIIL